MSNLSYSESIVIARSPLSLYEMISDVTRHGEWSPICQGCWWDDGDSAQVGAWFTGRNQVPGRTWETRSQVVVAQPGAEFAFMVGKSYVRWGYAFTAVDGGTRVTESWEFRPEGIAMFEQRYGPDAGHEIAVRTAASHDGIPATLAAIKRTAESTPIS